MCVLCAVCVLCWWLCCALCVACRVSCVVCCVVCDSCCVVCAVCCVCCVCACVYPCLEDLLHDGDQHPPWWRGRRRLVRPPPFPVLRSALSESCPLRRSNNAETQTFAPPGIRIWIGPIVEGASTSISIPARLQARNCEAREAQSGWFVIDSRLDNRRLHCLKKHQELMKCHGYPIRVDSPSRPSPTGLPKRACMQEEKLSVGGCMYTYT